MIMANGLEYTKAHFIEDLEDLLACQAGINWVKSQKGSVRAIIRRAMNSPKKRRKRYEAYHPGPLGYYEWFKEVALRTSADGANEDGMGFVSASRVRLLNAWCCATENLT